ncbi:kelch-like protein 33 [Hippocampus zosterae]|uniref:kelch-like protein 33 n=1 Tax=Hippocampus zosterae TaxID=109293 RepID=UPI00223CC6BA|nr:kelch-like protein 33 [Hippocampus zosterae]XP_051919670.1 kelch-like protein 33 [Hippocampus zosterae]
MEVAIPQLQPDREQWRKKVEQRVRRWARVDVIEETEEDTGVRVKHDGVDDNWVDEEMGAENKEVEEKEEVKVNEVMGASREIVDENEEEKEAGGKNKDDKEMREEVEATEDERLPVHENLGKGDCPLWNGKSQKELERRSSGRTGEDEKKRVCHEEHVFRRPQDGRRWQNETLGALRKGGEAGADETMATVLRKSHEEVDQEEQEESSDDDEAGCSEEDQDAHNIKMYRREEHHLEMFRTLTAFRDSALLTDLTLRTNDGGRLRLHSTVMGAVSSLVKNKLKHSVGEGERRYSISLGADVDLRGLDAIVDFAYTGRICHLEEDLVPHVETAAQALGSHRVLEFLRKQQEKTSATTQEEGNISAEEQMAISLHWIRKMWKDRVGCNVVLEAIGASLPVHRVILAACSDFFRGMFSSGMKESSQSRISLPFLSASDLEVLIEASYSGTLPLSWSCVFEISSTSLQFQYQPALSLTLDFLQRELNADFCLDVVSFAEAYQVAPLLEASEDFVLRQFQKVACTPKFKDLPAKQLLRYLNSHSLCVPSELVVFKAVAGWIQAKPKTRLKLARELMKTIHFPLMTFEEFKEVQSMRLWSEHKLADLYEAVWEHFCSNEVGPQSQWRIYLPKEILVLTGGDQISEDLGRRCMSREVWFGNSLMNHTGIRKAMEWRRLSELPDSARFCHEAAVVKGQLYVFGGKKYYGTEDTLNSVYRYDPLQNSWDRMADMAKKRCSFSAVVIDENIYAIGGRCHLDYDDSVECYSPAANSWSFARPLDLTLGGHVANVLKRQIFISGGLNSNNQCLASLFVYHPEKGSTYMANMSQARAHHCMETLDNRLYVAGGITADANQIAIDQLSCEVYDPATDSWNAFSALSVPHVGAASAVLEEKLYVMGGYSQEDYSDTNMLHRYDPALHRWENMGKMPGPNNDLRASVLLLPPHVRM